MRTTRIRDSGNEDSAGSFDRQVGSGERFEFGENWQRFLAVLDDERIREAERSLTGMLGLPALDGKTFLDVGSGSGLFSLAAKRLGASRIHSFDFDPSSVARTRELKRRCMPLADDWSIEEASVLDKAHVDRLGQWDVVYSWGVLHHTGDLRTGLEHVSRLVGPGGRLFISVYNDQGLKSRIWRRIKRVYNALPLALRTPFVIAVMGPRELLSAAAHAASGKPLGYVRSWTDYKHSRGISRWHNLVDWVGGYPFEVAKPEEIFNFYRTRGFALVSLTTAARGLGCNQYVF